MLENKTSYFLSLRKTETRIPCTILSMDGITEKLDSLNSFISILNAKLEKSTLPSFDSKERKHREITEIRGSIQKLTKEIEKEICEIYNTKEQVIEHVKTYLLNKLKITLLHYKQIEQKNLKYVEESIKSNNSRQIVLEEQLLAEEEQKSNNIQATLFNITNNVMQLKIAVKSQSSMIDTISRYFEESNVYLKKTNKEIEKMTGIFTKFKDCIIYFLLYVICVLLAMILIKTYLHRDLLKKSV